MRQPNSGLPEFGKISLSKSAPVDLDGAGRLKILQQSLDVIELDLRALRIGQTAAQLLQNPAHPLHVDFTGYLYRHIVTEFAPAQRPSKRIAPVATALLTARAITRAVVALAIAIALLHGLCEILGTLA